MENDTKTILLISTLDPQCNNNHSGHRTSNCTSDDADIQTSTKMAKQCTDVIMVATIHMLPINTPHRMSTTAHTSAFSAPIFDSHVWAHWLSHLKSPLGQLRTFPVTQQHSPNHHWNHQWGLIHCQQLMHYMHWDHIWSIILTPKHFHHTHQHHICIQNQSQSDISWMDDQLECWDHI